MRYFFPLGCLCILLHRNVTLIFNPTLWEALVLPIYSSLVGWSWYWREGKVRHGCYKRCWLFLPELPLGDDFRDWDLVLLLLVGNVTTFFLHCLNDLDRLYMGYFRSPFHHLKLSRFWCNLWLSLCFCPKSTICQRLFLLQHSF